MITSYLLTVPKEQLFLGIESLKERQESQIINSDD
jgi:hypothetical protein